VSFAKRFSVLAGIWVRCVGLVNGFVLKPVPRELSRKYLVLDVVGDSNPIDTERSSVLVLVLAHGISQRTLPEPLSIHAIRVDSATRHVIGDGLSTVGMELKFAMPAP
jgi:hypothetical protein